MAILPAIEGSEVDDVPEIVALAVLQQSRQREADQRRAPGEEAVLKIGRRIVATRQGRHSGVQMMAHRRQPADHWYPQILQAQSERDAELRVLQIKKKKTHTHTAFKNLSPRAWENKNQLSACDVNGDFRHVWSFVTIRKIVIEIVTVIFVTLNSEMKN